MSFEKYFGAGEAGAAAGARRRFDLHGWQRSFPDRAAAYFRATGMSAAEIAVSFNVTARTAQNWLEGISRPSGPAIALVAMRDRAGFEAHFAAPQGRAA